LKKPRVLIGILAVLLLLAACGGGSGVAATVNGVDISVSEVESMRVSEVTAATIDKVAFAADLTDAIINVAVVTAAKGEFSIEPSPAEIAIKKDELAAQLLAAQGISVEEFFAGQGLPIERFDVIVNQQLISELLYEKFTTDAVPASDADAQLLLSSDPIGRTTACVRHILLASEEEAVDARARIDGGEEFAVVATELGTDGTAATGGDLGCQPLGMYVAAFAEAAAGAEVGVVTGPVQSDFGWHLILVESKEVPSLDILRAEIDSDRINELVGGWFREAITDATVEVDEQFGIWVTEPNPMVQPPATLDPAG
jgi:peptidyl-prolyl cis-trans isomerase C